MLLLLLQSHTLTLPLPLVVFVLPSCSKQLIQDSLRDMNVDVDKFPLGMFVQSRVLPASHGRGLVRAQAS